MNLRLKAKTETEKLLYKENLHEIGLGNDFLDVNPKAQAMKTKMNKLEITSG